MESQIRALDERLRADREWENAIERLDQRLLNTSLESMKHLGRFFAHDEDQPDRILQMAWFSLEAQTLYLLRELDSSGVSRILGEVTPDYLADFSYSDASAFREEEERMLSDFEVPQEGWDRFWALVDRNKGEWLSQARELRPYSAYEHLSPE